jgi:hypothetical protein
MPNFLMIFHLLKIQSHLTIIKFVILILIVIIKLEIQYLSNYKYKEYMERGHLHVLHLSVLQSLAMNGV